MCVYLCLNEKVRKRKGKREGRIRREGGWEGRKGEKNSHTWEGACIPIFDHMKDSAGCHAEVLVSSEIHMMRPIKPSCGI